MVPPFHLSLGGEVAAQRRARGPFDLYQNHAAAFRGRQRVFVVGIELSSSLV
jgi:hypothetical protein